MLSFVICFSRCFDVILSNLTYSVTANHTLAQSYIEENSMNWTRFLKITIEFSQHWVLAITVMCYHAVTRWLSIDWGLGTLVQLIPIYYPVKANTNVIHASALSLSRTFCLNVRIFLTFVRNISVSHQWKTYLIMLMFATSMLLLKKPVSTIDDNVIICYLFLSFRFYIIQFPLLLTVNVVKYFL